MEKGDLYIQNVDGASRRMLYKEVRDAVWSPNGEEIAFTTGLEWPGPYHVCRMSLAGGEATCLQENVGDLAWAPDSKHLAFSGGSAVRLLDTATGVVQTLVDVGDEGAFYLDWSPDGKYLAYSRCYSTEANQGCEIYVVSSDGKEHWRLTRNRFADEFPVWQPIIPNTD
jgi:Tol biopolymer transport system component